MWESLPYNWVGLHQNVVSTTGNAWTSTEVYLLGCSAVDLLLLESVEVLVRKYSPSSSHHSLALPSPGFEESGLLENPSFHADHLLFKQFRLNLVRLLHELSEVGGGVRSLSEEGNWANRLALFEWLLSLWLNQAEVEVLKRAWCHIN